MEHRKRARVDDGPEGDEQEPIGYKLLRRSDYGEVIARLRAGLDAEEKPNIIVCEIGDSPLEDATVVQPILHALLTVTRGMGESIEVFIRDFPNTVTVTMHLPANRIFSSSTEDEVVSFDYERYGNFEVMTPPVGKRTLLLGFSVAKNGEIFRKKTTIVHRKLPQTVRGESLVGDNGSLTGQTAKELGVRPER